MPLKLLQVVPRGGDALTFAHLTVLVGANNAGKSQALRDITDYVCSANDLHLKVFEKISIGLPSAEEVKASVDIKPTGNPGNVAISGVGRDLLNKHSITAGDQWLQQQCEALDTATAQQAVLSSLGAVWIAHLDAEGRFKVAAPSETHDRRRESASNAMQAFDMAGRTALENLRKAFHEAFEVDIVLDWAGMRRLYLRIGTDFGAVPDGREELDALVCTAPELANQGDGFKSFAGIAVALLTFPNRLLLLDEPEAFLHPKQARVLGRWLATQAKLRSAQVVVATHSADFLWGVISANEKANVVRLNRTADVTRLHLVSATTTAALVRSPLLSSQPVPDALFHRGVVICEGDPDRAVYQTVAHSILGNEGGEDLLFIHTNGKDAIKGPAELMRNAGTPVYAAVDIDILNSEQTLSEIAMAITGEALPESLLNLRKRVAEHVQGAADVDVLARMSQAVGGWLDAKHSDLRMARRALEAISNQESKWDAVKETGINAFTGQARTDVQILIIGLMDFGLFVVPEGELESWMPSIAPKGRKWNRQALEELQNARCPPALLSFLRSIIKHHITNGVRLGRHVGTLRERTRP